ncbi:glycosyltransferase family 2 protein [Schaalia sp. Marseille-Q2122]|uniref:glycosyltransferase family 2 protein n=1 Tax=Schaalia sp. Marseille-Q2122 TaxID=2736604 RepID=UPI0015898AAD|nr:glycosyltransferase family 2 protein [Schaalia sp. Marseille-Q2122]
MTPLLLEGRDAEVTPPRVVVLMATFNGAQWIRQQIDSILAQEAVEVRLLVSDDGSEDDTVQIVDSYASRDSRVRLLPRRSGPPGVTGNFIHLFLNAQPLAGEYVAFADQDDLWHPNKLSRQIRLLTTQNADAVSSNVTAFDDNGVRQLIVKSQPQRRWDYLFEAGGPGSTYLFTFDLYQRLRTYIEANGYEGISVHDWFLYALARAAGAHWIIDKEPTVDYRQHEANVIGANRGIRAIRDRLRHLRSGHYRQQFLLMAEMALAVGSPTHDEHWSAELRDLIRDLHSQSFRSRLRLASRWPHLRRKRRQGLELAALCLLGQW